jgi:hypothetical protein
MGTQFVRKEVGNGEYLPSPILDQNKPGAVKPGSILVTGEYLGTKEATAKNGNTFTTHQFDVDGKTLSLSSGQLNYKLKGISVGEMVEVTFLGKKSIKLANGTSVNANQFSVVVLEEVTDENE